MTDWALVALEDLVEPERPITYGVVKPGDDPHDGVLFLRGQDVRDGQIIAAGARRITPAVSVQYSRTLLHGGEVVVVLVGTPGESAVVPDALKGANIARQLALLAVKSSVSPEYVSMYLRSPLGQSVLAGLTYGSVQQVINLGDLRRMRIPLPSLTEQLAIAGVLGAVDDKIESNRRQQSTLLSICHAAFDVSLMNGADVMRVDDMVRFRNNERKPLSAMERSGMKKSYPYYGATGIFDYVETYLFDDVNILIGEDGSVVNDDGTPVAQMAWGKYWVNNHAHVLSGTAVSTELAYIALARSDVRPLITGAVQLKINMGNLKSLEVALPSVEQRCDVDREIRENLALWRAKSDESRRLAGLRDALLPELLSGRLRVKDAESLRESV